MGNRCEGEPNAKNRSSIAMQKQPLCDDDTLLSSHPVTLFKVMFGNPWVDRLDRGRGGLLFREQEPRNPLQEISVGDCILLLGDLGYLYSWCGKSLHASLPLCVFFVRKSRTLYTSYGDLRSLFTLINQLYYFQETRSFAWNI